MTDKEPALRKQLEDLESKARTTREIGHIEDIANFDYRGGRIYKEDVARIIERKWVSLDDAKAVFGEAFSKKGSLLGGSQEPSSQEVSSRKEKKP